MLSFALLFFVAAEIRLTAGESVLVFTNVAVIDATGAPTRPGETVTIAGGRISGVGPAGTAFPTNAQIINGTGKFLIPGLWDMHVHWDDKEYLPLFIANGVTGVRIMWGFPDHHEWRQQIEGGSLLGPRLFIASSIVDGPKPIWPDSTVASNAEEGRQAVAQAIKDHADFIKVYSLLPREAYFAIAAEARKRGIPFAGHTPIAVSAGEASDAGQKSIEHLTEILTACSTNQAELLKSAQDYLVERLATTNAPSIVTRLRDTRKVELESFDPAKAEALFARFKRNHTWQCPTLTVLYNIAFLDSPSLRDDPRLQYMPATLRYFWMPTNDFRFRGRTAEDIELGRKTYRKQLELVGAMQRAGVGILAGTDVSNPFCYPGFSLHDELRRLVEAGLRPMQALLAATLNAARFMGREKELGTIQKGKMADLVLLDANPLDDIANTKRINAVVFSGRLFTREALDRMLSDAAARAGGSKPALAFVLGAIVEREGVAAAIKRYRELETNQPAAYDFGEPQLNMLGYYLLGQNRASDAVEILKLNAEFFPNSANVYDSLGEAYLAAGDKVRSIENYQHSIKLDPANHGAEEKLKQLQAR